MAHTGPQPIDVLPGVPAISETLPGFVTWEWNGMFAPAHTDSALIARLNGELNQVIGEAAVKQRLTELGALTKANTVAEFAAFREQQIPCDALYLADSYTENQRAFTWDRERFPAPAVLIRELGEQGRLVRLWTPPNQPDQWRNRRVDQPGCHRDF